MNAIAELREATCASLPPTSLEALAAIRDLPGITVMLAGNRVWIRWESDDDRILRSVFPIAGVKLYVQRDGTWHQHARHIPAFDVPKWTGARSLAEVLTPILVAPIAPTPLTAPRIPVTIVRDTVVRASTALRCRVVDLANWAESMPSTRLQSLRAAKCSEDLLVLGDRLPHVPNGMRYWGDKLLVPLGYRPEPDLPAATIREAQGLAEDEVLLLDHDGADVIPLSVFQQLKRGHLRTHDPR